MADAAPDITALLHRWGTGDAAAFDELLPLVYDDLHSIALGLMRRERATHTLQPTALLHEFYFRLLQRQNLDWANRRHFYTFAAKLMRLILVDHARGRLAQRRGGSDAVHIPLTDDLPWLGTQDTDLLDLHRALEKLEELDPAKVRLIELRFFLALTLEEVAEVLEVSRSTVDREIRFLRTWLFRELRGGAA